MLLKNFKNKIIKGQVLEKKFTSLIYLVSHHIFRWSFSRQFYSDLPGLFRLLRLHMTLRGNPYVSVHWSLIIYYSQLDRVAVQFFAITMWLYQQWFSYFLRKIRRSWLKVLHLCKFSLSLSSIYFRKTLSRCLNLFLDP